MQLIMKKESAEERKERLEKESAELWAEIERWQEIERRLEAEEFIRDRPTVIEEASPDS
jgi:hypothetical protein